MSRGKLVGRPNQPKPSDLDAARQVSDVTSREFTSNAKGVAMQQPPPPGAGHSYEPGNPYRYSKRPPGPTHPKVNA